MKTRYLSALLTGGTEQEIYDRAIAVGAPACVARDLASEPAHAAELAKKRKSKTQRNQRRLFMLSVRDRRITKTRNRGGRIHEYHATKGWRHYRDVYAKVR